MSIIALLSLVGTFRPTDIIIVVVVMLLSRFEMLIIETMICQIKDSKDC